MNRKILVMSAAVVVAVFPTTLFAQNAHDPSARLAEVLPANIVQHVLDVIAKARSHNLPADALAQRALKFAAKGVAPAAIATSVSEHADRMLSARGALTSGRASPTAGEIEAAADALRMGVDGKQVSELAKSAPSGRSLAVPLLVIGALVDRGLPSDAALQRVLDKLDARASDADLQAVVASLPPQAANGLANKPEVTGQDLAATKRPELAGPRSGIPPSSPPGGPPAAPPAVPPSGVTPPVGPPAGVPPTTNPPGRGRGGGV